MEKRDPLKEVGNIDKNEPQEVAVKEVPEVTVSSESSSDKENGFFTPLEKPEVENAEIELAVGCGSRPKGSKLRLSFLKAFDPLYSESPEKYTKLQKRPQLGIEELESSDSSQLIPLPSDVSDDEATFVDATTLSSDEASDKHLQFYTPETFDVGALIHSENISTSNVVDSDSVLPNLIEQASTSEIVHTSIEKRKLHGPNRLKPKTNSPHSPVVVPCKKQRITETELIEAIHSKLQSDPNKSPEIIVDDDSNSEISDIKTDSPDISQGEQSADSSGDAHIEKHASPQFDDTDNCPDLPETSDVSLKRPVEDNTISPKSSDKETAETLEKEASSGTFPDLPKTSDKFSSGLPADTTISSEAAVKRIVDASAKPSSDSETYPELPDTSDESSRGPPVDTTISSEAAVKKTVDASAKPSSDSETYPELPDTSDESSREPPIDTTITSETAVKNTVDASAKASFDSETYPELPDTSDESSREPPVDTTISSEIPVKETVDTSAKPSVDSELPDTSDECPAELLANKTVEELPKTTEEEISSTLAEELVSLQLSETEHSEKKVDEEVVKKPAEGSVCQDNKESSERTEEDKQEIGSFSDKQSSPGVEEVQNTCEKLIDAEDKSELESLKGKVEPVVESSKSLKKSVSAENVKDLVTPTHREKVVPDETSEKESAACDEEIAKTTEKISDVETEKDLVNLSTKQETLIQSLEKEVSAENVKDLVAPTQREKVVSEETSEKEAPVSDEEIAKTTEESSDVEAEKEFVNLSTKQETLVQSLEKEVSAENVKDLVTPTQREKVVSEESSEKEAPISEEEIAKTTEEISDVEAEKELVNSSTKQEALVQSLETEVSAEDVKDLVTPTQREKVVSEETSEKEAPVNDEEIVETTEEISDVQAEKELVNLSTKQEALECKSVENIHDQKFKENVNTSEICTSSEEEKYSSTKVGSNEDPYFEHPDNSTDDLKHSKKKQEEKVSDDEKRKVKVKSDAQETLDEVTETISEETGHNEQTELLTETSNKIEPEKGECTDGQENLKEEGKRAERDSEKSIANKVTLEFESLKIKMADLSEKLSEQQQENSDLKLQLNASQQAKATLELEIRQKEEIIIKTQAEAMKIEQVYKQEIKQLREKLKENSKLIEKDGSKELEEQLKEAKARETKAIAELNQRNKDDLNYQKIMEEYENTIATRFADYQKLKEEHDTATRHLANLELAFSDVHQKYERSKSILLGYKSNEETLVLSLQASEKTCKQHEERYESLKAHAQAQIEKSNKEILLLRDKYEMDINKLKAIIKRLEIKCCSLEVSLQQKTEECAALSALCDEVTGKRM